MIADARSLLRRSFRKMIPVSNGEPVSSTLPLEWKFSQVFGERAAGEEVQEVDIISAIEFDKSGEHLATGDRGGRVVLFERTDGKDHTPRKDLEMMDFPAAKHPEFRYKTEFQSHEPEFDYLKSLEIEEKINKVRWCQTASSALFLLTTNDKTVKYWKVQERKVKKICDMNLDSSALAGHGSQLSLDFVIPSGGIPSLHLPVVVGHETSLVPRCRRVYAHAHDYHINSISTNRSNLVVFVETIICISNSQLHNSVRCSDGETFISADDLRINLWHLEISNQSYNIVDVKPVNMEDLTEVITSAEFHPAHCNTLAYSSSKGTIRLIDMRQSALCDSHAKLFEEKAALGSRSFFSEIIASISDIKFGKDGRYLLSRDYMTMKLWDLNMDSAPVATFQVHEHLQPKLCDLYENDSIFDKFECCLSGDGFHVATAIPSVCLGVPLGALMGRLWKLAEILLVLGFEWHAFLLLLILLLCGARLQRRQAQTPSRPSRSLTSLTRARRREVIGTGVESSNMDANGGAHDFSAKLLHLAWHPDRNVIACAAANSLYMYFAEESVQHEKPTRPSGALSPVLMVVTDPQGTTLSRQRSRSRHTFGRGTPGRRVLVATGVGVASLSWCL
ncbi:hypothetical protein Taro_003291 [Colocasia esculenta]|uniref:Serine/threonine-protein phosphatase 2A 55 kDa regulatory subunit B n=1 Tax=Colocasia esculenta TaxID=4460 RepID=A0A843TN77_COLES|nr:hypothetical protein [Colocasia esculenta]